MSIYPYIAKRLIFSAGDRFLGTHIVKSLNELEEKQWWEPEKIKSDQSDKLSKLIKHSYENVPFWRETFNKLKLTPSDIKTKEDLKKLPVLTKDCIRKNLSRMLAANFPKKRFMEQHSSGSTGEPVKYYIDKHHYSCNVASMLRFWKWAGYDSGMKWVRLSLWPHDRLLEKLYDRLARCLYIRVFGMDEEAMAKDVQRIRKFKPEIIRGYASATYLLTKYAYEHGIDDIKPKAVITTGDMLFSHYRKLMEEQYNCKVYDTYGGEGTMIYGQCEHGSYHIDDNNVIIEFLKDNGNPAEPGELANITITCLNNYSMPFIRYNIQDLGKARSGFCSCGRKLSLMGAIEGRNSDIITTPENSHLIVHFFTGLFEFIEGVDQFQIVQKKLDEIEIKIVKNDKFTEDDVQHITNTIKKGGGQSLKIIFNFVDDIPVQKSGKRRFVISETKPQLGS